MMTPRDFSANNPETLIYAIYGALHADRTSVEFTRYETDLTVHFLPGYHEELLNDKDVTRFEVYEFGDGDAELTEPDDEMLSLIRRFWDIAEPLCVRMYRRKEIVL